MQIDITLNQHELKGMRTVLSTLHLHTLLKKWRALEARHWATRGLVRGHVKCQGMPDFTFPTQRMRKVMYWLGHWRQSVRTLKYIISNRFAMFNARIQWRLSKFVCVVCALLIVIASYLRDPSSAMDVKMHKRVIVQIRKELLESSND